MKFTMEIIASSFLMFCFCIGCISCCPSACSCFSEDEERKQITMECVSTNLTSFPTQLPPNVEKMIFIDNPDLQWPNSTDTMLDFTSPNVTSIVYENNGPLTNLTNVHLSFFTQLKFLTIRRSHLSWIEPELFGSLPQLQYLDLSQNPQLRYEVIFSSVNHSNTRLATLNISQCNNLKEMSNLKNAHAINLFKSPIKVMDMSSTNLFYISPGLSYFLPHIEVLNISRNHLRIDFTILCDIARMKNLTVFDISHWSTPDLFYKLEDPDVDNLLPTEFSPCKTDNGNESTCFPLAESLRLFYFHHIRWSSAESQTISKCVSKNKMTKVWLNNNNYRLFNGSIRGAQYLRLMDFSENNIEYFSPEFFFYEPLLEAINLRANKLSKNEHHVNFTNLIATNRYMQHIDLSQNGLSHLPYNIFRHNNQLISFNLSSNKLSNTLKLNLSSSYIRYVDLSYNKLSSLDKEMLNTLDRIHARASQDVSGRLSVFDEVPPFSWDRLTVDFSGNPFVCECKYVKFLIWIKTTNVYLRNFENYECIYRGKSMLLSNVTVEMLDKTCDFVLSNSLIVTAILVPLAIAIVIMCIAMYKKLKKMQMLRKVRNYRSNDPPRYVAFMCYSHHDSDFVLGDLRPDLERRLANDLARSDGLLCINDRDFSVGEPIEEAIVRSVTASSMVILVISEKFLDSQWCKFEMNVAWMEKKPMLMILRHKVKIEKLPHLLRNIYEKHVRLLWMGEKRKHDFIETLYSSIIKQL